VHYKLTQGGGAVLMSSNSFTGSLSLLLEVDLLSALVEVLVVEVVVVA
jgi:hypothetical protein